MKCLIVALVALCPHLGAGEVKSWPPVEYSHVVAYCYDYTRDPRGSGIVFEDGTHHRGIIVPFTRNLLESKHAKLEELLNPSKELIDEEVDCYDPHHALVFYDKDWKPVASIDLCFACADFRARPAHPAKELGWREIEAFFKVLGMPTGDEVNFTELFERHQGPEPKPTKPVPSTDGDPFAPGASEIPR